jgi:hypothetical protein
MISHLRLLFCFEKKNLNTLRVFRFSILVISSIYFFSAKNAFADCQMTKIPRQHFFLDPAQKTSGLVKTGSTDISQQKVITVENCGTSAKFIAMSLGVRNPYHHSDTADIFFRKDFKEDTCKIDFLPVTEYNFEDRKRALFSKLDLVRNCVSYDVRSADGRPLQIAQNQAECFVQKTGVFSARLTGDFCFAPVRPDTKILITLSFNQQCLSLDYFKNKNLISSDVDTTFQIFQSMNSDGSDTDTMIGSSRYFFSFLPTNPSIKKNTDVTEEEPQFPTDFNLNVWPAEITFRPDGDGSVINSQLFLNHQLRTNCLGTECNNLNDHMFPLATETELQILDKQKWQSLDTWQSMNDAHPFVPTQWQGLIRLANRNLPYGTELVGKKLRLVHTFTNPKIDYDLYVQSKVSLIDFSQFSVIGTAGRDMLSPLNSLRGILGLNPVPMLPQFGGGTLDTSIESFQKMLESQLTNHLFPTFYERQCGQASNSSCFSISQKKHIEKLVVEFTLSGLDADTQTFPVSNTRWTRDSDQSSSNQLPTLSCP